MTDATHQVVEGEFKAGLEGEVDFTDGGRALYTNDASRLGIGHGEMPQFATMAPNMKNLRLLRDVANYLRTVLKDIVDAAMWRQIRASWTGKLIVEGVSDIEDAGPAVIAKFIAHGAQMVFAVRAFTYGVGAFGVAGADHTIDILRDEL